MEKGYGKFIFYTVSMVVLAVVVFCAYQYNVPHYDKYKQLLAQCEDAQKKNLELRLALDELRDKQIRFAEDPEFVSDVARENGYVYPGEIVFTYTPDQP